MPFKSETLFYYNQLTFLFQTIFSSSNNQIIVNLVKKQLLTSALARALACEPWKPFHPVRASNICLGLRLWSSKLWTVPSQRFRHFVTVFLLSCTVSLSLSHSRALPDTSSFVDSGTLPVLFFPYREPSCGLCLFADSLYHMGSLFLFLLCYRCIVPQHANLGSHSIQG